jgi:uncharacterized membrane protein
VPTLPEPTQPEKDQFSKDTSRLDAFSDGVFAIAITLLALDLKIPHMNDLASPTSASLWASLEHEWPEYFAVITSFFSVLIMWVHHHTVFRWVRRTDRLLLFTNGLLLLFVTVVPFPTALVAEYLNTPAAPAAAALYACIFLGISIAFLLMLLAALRPSIMDPAAPPATVRRLRRSYFSGPPGYLLAAIAAPFSPWLAMGICTMLWILWAATTRD